MVGWQRTVPLLLAVVLLCSGRVKSKDILDEIGREWKMGLRPRQEDSNLQSFTGALGGVSASAVCFVATLSGDLKSVTDV